MEKDFFPVSAARDDLMDDFWERIFPGIYLGAKKDEEPAE